MSFISTIYAYLFYFAAFVLVAGLAAKVIQYARTPAPLKIPTTPAPTTQSGVVLRMFREVVFFESLFKGTKWTWIFSWAFHMGMFLVLVRILHSRWYDPEAVFGPQGGTACATGPTTTELPAKMPPPRAVLGISTE